MSTLQVANVWLESTGNNRIQYTGSNTVAIVIAGANVITANSTTAIMPLATSFTGSITGNASFSGNVGIGNTTPATKLQIDGNYGVKTTSLSAGNNHNINCASGNYFIVTANSSAQNVYFTSTPSGTLYSMTIRFANGNGGNTISWANTPKWPSATAPTPSTNNDIWVFLTEDGGTTWRGNLVQRDSR